MTTEKVEKKSVGYWNFLKPGYGCIQVGSTLQIFLFLSDGNIDNCQAQKLQPPHLSFNISIVLQIDFNLPFSEVFLRIGSMITCSSGRECRLSDAIDLNLLGLVIYARTSFS